MTDRKLQVRIGSHTRSLEKNKMNNNDFTFFYTKLLCIWNS